MAVVSETLELPGGGAPSNVTVTVTLAGESGRPLPAAYDLAGNTIVGSHQVVPVAGVWSVTLDRNDEIIPAGTAWKIVLAGPGVSAKPRFVSVVGAGPFDVEDILTDAPASIDPSTYALLDTRVDALETTTQPLDADLTTIAALDSATAGALATDGAGWVRKTYAQLKTALGLGNVDNTADSAKPVSIAQQTALDSKAPLASPALTGTPTAPTAAQGTNTTQLATTAHVQGEAALLVPRSILTTDGDLFTRTGGVVARMTRASLAADAAFTGAFAQQNLNTIALLGDSIPGQNSDFVNTLPASTGFLPKGYWTWAAALLGYRMTQVRASATEWEFGGSGLTTPQLVSGGHVDAVIAAQPGWCLVHVGTNDMSGGATAATITTDLAVVYGMLRDAGIRVVALTILPRTDTNAAQEAVIRDVNTWIRRQGRESRGVVVVDAFNAILNPASNDAVSTYLYDTVHPSDFGAGRVGKAIFDVLDPLVPKINPLDMGGADDTKNLVSNPYMTGDASGAATNLSIYASGTPTFTKSKVARSDIHPGEWQQIHTTVATNDQGVNALWQNTAVGVDWAVGETVVGMWEFETDATDWACRVMSLTVICVNGAQPNQAWWGFSTSSARAALPAGSLYRPAAGVMMTVPQTIPAGTTNMQLLFSNFGTAKIRLGRAALLKI